MSWKPACCVAVILTSSILVTKVPDARAGARTCFGQAPTIVGTSGRDDLNGTDGPDVIWAKAGTDTVHGKGGADLICGGRGRDALLGGNDGRDRMSGAEVAMSCTASALAIS
jgi:Ca2+-binding RTX toxin-like protein